MKKYKGFIPAAKIDFDKNLIRGKVLNTRDTITFYGNTPAEAQKAFQDSVDDYLEFCKEIGVKPAKPFGGQILLRVDAKTHRKLIDRAQLKGQSVNTLIKNQLRFMLEKTPASRSHADPSKSKRKLRPSPE